MIAKLVLRPALVRWAAPVRALRQTLGVRPTRPSLAEARRILVIRPDEIGDVVLTGPFLRALRQAAPHAGITLVVKTACFDLVEHCPYVDHVRAVDFSGSVRHRALHHWRLAWRLRLYRDYRRGFDLVLLPRRGPDYYGSIFLAYLLAGRGTVLAHRECDGDATCAELVDAYYVNHDVEHEVLHNLKFLRWCGANCQSVGDLEMWLNAADHQFAQDVLGNGAYVAFGAGAGDRARCWPIDHFADIAAGLRRRHGYVAVQLGAAGDPDFDGGMNLIGRTTLRQAAAVIARCFLFVGNDSGLKHLAAAVGVPVVEISAFRLGGNSGHPNSPARFQAIGIPRRMLQPAEGSSALAIGEVNITSVLTACFELIMMRERNEVSHRC